MNFYSQKASQYETIILSSENNKSLAEEGCVIFSLVHMINEEGRDISPLDLFNLLSGSYFEYQGIRYCGIDKNGDILWPIFNQINELPIKFCGRWSVKSGISSKFNNSTLEDVLNNVSTQNNLLLLELQSPNTAENSHFVFAKKMIRNSDGIYKFEIVDSIETDCTTAIKTIFSTDVLGIRLFEKK